MKELLKGIRVIDFTGFAAGPSCTKLLRDYGAEVILVESVTGSTTRIYAPNLVDFYTAGKKSLPLNLKTQEGQEIMRRLILSADVFVHNFRTKAIERLGLDYETLHKINPRLIWGGLNGYGMSGPDKDLPGYDTTSFWARGGMMMDFAEKGTILVPPFGFGDTAAGQALAGAVCAALYHREKTGEGEKLYVSLYGEALYLNHENLVEAQCGVPYPQSRKSPMRSLLNTYRCKDGKWIAIMSTQFEKDFDNILRGFGRADLIGDPRWRRIEDTMFMRSHEMVEILDEASANYTQEELLNRLKDLDVSAIAVRSWPEVITDEQAFANQYVYRYTNESGRNVVMPVSPVKIGNDDMPPVCPTPRVGENTKELLAEFGYSEAEIEKLIENGITVSAK